MKLSIFSVIAFFCLIFGSCHAEQVISDEQAINSLRHFYIFYIKEKSKGTKDRVRKIDSLLQQYSTPRLTEQLKEQDEEDYDFIINAQGAEVEWLNTLTITRDGKENDIYDVCWQLRGLPGEKIEKTRVKLKLIKSSTGILIDRIIR